MVEWPSHRLPATASRSGRRPRLPLVGHLRRGRQNDEADDDVDVVWLHSLEAIGRLPSASNDVVAILCIRITYFWLSTVLTMAPMAQAVVRPSVCRLSVMRAL